MPVDRTGDIDEEINTYVVIYETTEIPEEQMSADCRAKLIDQRSTMEPEGYDSETNGAKMNPHSETGYMMRFVNERDWQLRLNAFDIMTIPYLASYPINQQILDSLPATVIAKLEQHGFVQIRGHYDKEEKAFTAAKLGWERSRSIEGDEWIEFVMDEYGCSATIAVDYAMVALENESGATQHNVETWAGIRDVTPKAIKKSVSKVTSQVDDELLSPTGEEIIEQY